MKKFNLFSKLCSPLVGSQSSDVGFDCRFTVGSPSELHSSALLKFVSILVLVLTIGVGQMWGADGDVAYTLSLANYYSGTKPSGYAVTQDVVFGTALSNKTWNVPGNCTLGSYFAVGGSSISGVDRVIYGKSTITNVIKQVKVNYSGVTNGKSSSLTLNSAKLEVSGESDFSDIDETVNLSSLNITSSSPASYLSFTPTGSHWASGKYYRLSFNCTTSGSKNCHFDITSIEFIEGTSADCNANPSTANASINGSFTLTSLTDAVSVSSGTWGTGSSDCSWTDYGFVWGTTSSPTVSNNKVQVGTSGKGTSWSTDATHKVQPSGSTNPTSWSVGTTYYVKAYGKNGKDEAAFAYSTTAAYFTLRSIDFEENGGSTVNTIYANSGGTATKPSDPTRTGYTFGGWYKEAGLSNAVTWASDAISANKTYYAKWTAKQCTVTFDKEGGSGGDNSVTATYDAAMTTVTVPTKTDYIFGGYWDGDNGTGNQYYKADGTSNASWNKNTTSNTTLYAKWTEHTYTRYRTSCCTQWDDPTISYGSYSLSAGGSHTTITITGTQHGTLSFESSNVSVISVNGSTGEVTPVGAGTAHVIATWASDGTYCDKVMNSADFTVTGSVTVNFNANGGSLSTTSQNIPYNTSTALTTFANLTGSAPSCKQFDHWNTANDDSGTSYTDGQSITLLSGLTLYAIYSNITYAVSDGTMTGVTSHSYSSNPVTCGTTLTITCAADASHKGNPTVTATGTHGAINVVSATSVTIANVQSDMAVSISYTAKENYAITWKVNNAALTGAAIASATNNVLEGNGITALPTAPASLTCADSFIGWTDEAHNNGTTAKTASYYTGYLYKDPSDFPSITDNTTFYAVYANVKVVGVDPVSITSFATGDYYLIDYYSDNYYAMSGTGTSKVNQTVVTSIVSYNSTTGRLTITDESSLTAANVYTISGSTSAAKIYNDNSKAWVTTQSSGTSFSDSEGTNVVTKHASAPRFAFTYASIGTSGNRAVLYRYSQSGWCNYAESNMGASGYGTGYMWMVPKGVPAEYEDYVTQCCTPLDEINGDKTSLVYNGVTLTWNDIDHVSSWTVTGVDGSSAAVPAGNIGTPTDGGSTYSCVISNLSQYTDYTFTITATPASGYCDASEEVSFKTPCVAPGSLSIASTGNKWDFCAGETMTLTVSGTNISASATYQWEKWNGSTWDEISGATSASYSTTMAAAKAGQYHCIVTNPGSSCDATTSGVWVRVWQLHINNGAADAYQDLDFTNTGTGTGSNTTVYLTSDKGYQFKLINNNGGWFGKNSTTITSNTTDLALAGDLGLANVNITSGLEGNYTFAIDYSDKDNPTISVTYPTADQPNNRDIWFDKSVVDGWGNGLYYRIGSETWHKNNTKAGGTAWTLVPGTDKFYTTKTMAFDGFVAWTISNNSAWCADEWDNHSIYGNATDEYKITKAIDFQKYVVGASGVTIVPTAYHNTDANSCDYWNVSKTDGMLKHTAIITSYSHGTVTVAYTKYDGTGAASFTTGSNDDLAHRCILTITAVPDAGYSLTSLQVNGANFTSGNNHILSADATITAVFSAQTSTVTFDKQSGTGGSNSVTATYDAAMPAATMPTRDHYSFGGYYDNADWTLGTQYYTNAGASAHTWDKTGAQTLYAKWTGDTYNITYKDQGNVAYSGDVTAGVPTGAPTTHTYGEATALVNGTKTGYTFGGWYTDASCTVSAGSSIGATTQTADFTLYAKWTIENYSVTWKVNGSDYTTGSPTDNADYNTKVSTLPSNPSAPEGCSDKVFKGWSTSNLGDASGQSAPGDLFTTAEGSPAITAATTFYAVFADETPESSTTTWTKIGNTSDLATGTYAILTYQFKAFTGSISSGHGGQTSDAFSFTDNVATSAPAGMQEVTITRVAANQFRISRVVDVEGVPTTQYLHATKCGSGGLEWNTGTGSNYWFNNSSPGHGIRYSVQYKYSNVDTYPYMLSTTNDPSFRTSGTDNSYYLWFAKKGSVVTPASWSNYVTLCDEPAECGTPTFDPGTDTYNETQTVTIGTTTPGATIRYTTDGTTPTSSVGTVYSTPVEVSCTTTLKAIAYKAGREDSEVGIATITIKVPDPTFSINSGTYYAVQNVTLSCDLAGATIYYETTNDGSEPTTPTSSSTEYTGAINIPANSTIKVSAIAIKDGCATASEVVTKTYVVRVGTNYTLVTDVNDLNEGDKVVIVADNGNTKNAVNSYAGGNDRPSTNDFDFANNEKTAVTVYPLKVGDTYTVQVFELQGEPGAWVFKAVTDDTKKYLGLKDDNNYLKTYTADTDDQTKWTIDITNGIAHIANKQRTTRYIEYNSSGSKFACYTSNQTARTKIYSVPNPDPVIKVEGSLSAFAGCTSEASAAQSFYVCGKNLSASIRVTAPTGYEVSLSSGSGYADYIDVACVGTAVAKTQVYVRIKTGQDVGSPSGNVVVSVSADELSKNVAVSGTVSANDTYIDRMHGNETSYQCGSYDAPDLSDDDGSTGTDCQKTYPTFQGWVAEDNINADGTLKAGTPVISAGDSKTADGTTYYSVWGEE